MTHDKEAIEVAHAKALMTFLKLDVGLERPDPPAPDFQFRNGIRIIGLEHTRLFAVDGSAKNSLQARETFLGKISQAATTEYLRRDLPPIEVKLHLADAPIAQNQFKPLIRRIVDLVEENLPSENGRIRLSFENVDDFPPELNSIHMIRFPGQTGRSFFAPYAAIILSADQPHIQERIDNKGQKIAGYLHSRDEVWLLVVADGSKLSTWVELPESLWQQSFHFCGFSRIFVLEKDAVVHELKSASAGYPGPR